jgi:hypothetical protein
MLVRERQHEGPQGSGGPAAQGGTSALAAEVRHLAERGRTIIDRALSDNGQKFLAANRQSGGQ